MALSILQPCPCTVCIIIAERSEANNRVLWAQQSQLAFISIYTYVRTYVRLSLDPEGKARVQNGVSGSFLGAVFEVVAGTKSEVWTNLS